MKEDRIVLTFSSRKEFRSWLEINCETHSGVWLAFDKTKNGTTLSANDALEEALCFGWIDSQLKSIDEGVYHKYFSKRRAKSIWSDKNKKLIAELRQNGQMTEYGLKAIEVSKENGMWDKTHEITVGEQEIKEFAALLEGISPAYENYMNMSFSVKKTYCIRYLSFKTEQARQRDFLRIIERLNSNLKPM